MVGCPTRSKEWSAEIRLSGAGRERSDADSEQEARPASSQGGVFALTLGQAKPSQPGPVLKETLSRSSWPGFKRPLGKNEGERPDHPTCWREERLRDAQRPILHVVFS